MTNKITVINPHGFCGNENGFGVQRAINLAIKTAKKYPDKVYLLGEIVHNQHVVDQLETEFRIKTVQNLNEIPDDGVVIIRSHGAIVETIKQIKNRGLTFVDATCPLVNQCHQEVKKLAKEGKKIIYIASDLKHDEAVGVASEAPENVTLTTLTKVVDLIIEDPENTVVLTQTTLSILETQETLDSLRNKYPQLTIKPHICPATTQRQQAVIEAAKNHQLIIIVGAPASSNSNRLRDVAKEAGAEAYIVDNANEIKPQWFTSHPTVAVSSGASTPEEIFQEVLEKINTFYI